MNKYEVKNVKTFVGREGYGFNASLYKNGKRLGMVIDDASGGELEYQIDREEIEELKQYVIQKIGGEKPYMFLEMDCFVNDLVEDYDWKRKCKKNVLVKLKSDPKGTYRQLNIKYAPHLKQEIIGFFENKGEMVEEILNEKYIV